jgi:hypothetical protein
VKEYSCNLKTDIDIPVVLNPLILVAKRYRKANFTSEQARKFQKGSRSIAIPHSLTSATDGGWWSKPSPRETDPASTAHEADWDPGTKNLAPTGI